MTPALVVLVVRSGHLDTIGDDGQLVLLADQDRTAWDRAGIAEGVGLVRKALVRRPPGRFAFDGGYRCGARRGTVLAGH